MSRPKPKHIVAEKLIEELADVAYQETKKSAIKYAIREYFKNLGEDRLVICEIEEL